MPKVVKVIELLSESPKSWEDAAQSAVIEASKTLRNIRSIYIKEFTAAVDNGKVTRSSSPLKGNVGNSAVIAQSFFRFKQRKKNHVANGFCAGQ